MPGLHLVEGPVGDQDQSYDDHGRDENSHGGVGGLECAGATLNAVVTVIFIAVMTAAVIVAGITAAIIALDAQFSIVDFRVGRRQHGLEEVKWLDSTG